jgi:hypothetical protein
MSLLSFLKQMNNNLVSLFFTLFLTIALLFTFLPNQVIANPEALAPCGDYIHLALDEYHIRNGEYPEDINLLIKEGENNSYRDVDPFIGNFSGCSGSIFGEWSSKDFDRWNDRYNRINLDKYKFDGSAYTWNFLSPVSLFIKTLPEETLMGLLVCIPFLLFIFNIILIIAFRAPKIVNTVIPVILSLIAALPLFIIWIDMAKSPGSPWRTMFYDYSLMTYIRSYLDITAIMFSLLQLFIGIVYSLPGIYAVLRFIRDHDSRTARKVKK